MANDKESVKPVVTFTDKDGKEIKKNVEDLSDNSKLALVRIDEISKDKIQMQKNLIELDVLHKYYSNILETEVKGEGK
jgi:hypothetical protein